MVMIGTDWTDITEGDPWSDATGYGNTIYWRVLGKATIDLSNRTARIDFKWQARVNNGNAYNWDSHKYTVSCSGHSATTTWAFNNITSTSWVDVGNQDSPYDDYWSGLTYSSNGTYSVTATISGTRWGNSAFSWTQTITLPNIYTVTLDKNNGSGGTSSVNILHGTIQGYYPSITLPTRSGYTFNGYWTTASGGTQYYDAQGNSTRDFNNATQTWYAHWTQNTPLTVRINPNGGQFRCGLQTTLTTEEKTFTVTSESNILGIFGYRPGYYCAGWYTQASGGSWVAWNGENLMNVTSNKVLYAHWTPYPKNSKYDLWVKTDNSWLHGIPWIKINGTWYWATRISVKVNDAWKETKIN